MIFRFNHPKTQKKSNIIINSYTYWLLTIMINYYQTIILEYNNLLLLPKI
jgi:hypothetical protein